MQEKKVVILRMFGVSFQRSTCCEDVFLLWLWRIMSVCLVKNASRSDFELLLESVFGLRLLTNTHNIQQSRCSKIGDKILPKLVRMVYRWTICGEIPQCFEKDSFQKLQISLCENILACVVHWNDCLVGMDRAVVIAAWLIRECKQKSVVRIALKTLELGCKFCENELLLKMLLAKVVKNSQNKHDSELFKLLKIAESRKLIQEAEFFEWDRRMVKKHLRDEKTVTEYLKRMKCALHQDNFPENVILIAGEVLRCLLSIGASEKVL